MVLGKKHNQNDYVWGRQQEEKCNEHLNDYFQSTLVNSKDQYARWDYTDGKIKIEMKSRKNISYDSYATTFISEDKCRYADANTFFVFNFVYDFDNDLSDLYCIRYEKEKFKTFLKKNLRNDYSLIEIPVSELTHIVQEIM